MITQPQKISRMKPLQITMPTRYATWSTKHPDKQVGQFSEWLPYLNACLLYQGHLVTKKQDHHVTTAATTNTLEDTIIKDSKKWDPTIDTKWTEDSFELVDWQAHGSSFKALAPGWQLQMSKYAHEWTPTMHHQAQISNKIDWWLMLCVWPPQRKCVTHATMPKCLSTSCPLQGH
jgi:hypothetical protein